MLRGAEDKTAPAPSNALHRSRRPHLLSLMSTTLRDLRPGVFDAPFYTKVRELVLARTGLRRLRAGTLRGLRTLRTLDLSDNALRTVPSAALAAAPALAVLDLSGNSLVALADGAFVGAQLRRLRTLRLGNNALRAVGPRALQGLPRLRELDLAGNRLARLPALLLRPARALDRLDLADNAFASTAALPGAQRVLQLRLRDGRLTALPARAFASAAEPARTRSLSLSGHALARVDEDALEGYGVLRVLDLSRNRLSSLPPELFRSCPALTHLFLGRNRLSRLDAFVHLREISFLDLNHNHITELAGATLPCDGPAALVALRLEHNGMRRVTPTALQHLPALRVLYLSQNVLRSFPAAALDACPQLGFLDLTANRLTDARAARRLARVPHVVLALNRLAMLPGPGTRRRAQSTKLGTNSISKGPNAPDALQASTAPEESQKRQNSDADSVTTASGDPNGSVNNALTSSIHVSSASKSTEHSSKTMDTKMSDTFKSPGNFEFSEEPKTSDMSEIAHTSEATADSKPSGTFKVPNDLTASKVSITSRTADVSKPASSSVPDDSKTPIVSQFLDDFEYFDNSDSPKITEMSIGSDISKLPYIADSSFEVPKSSNVPYALDNFHASKTTEASNGVPDDFDASRSFDTLATPDSLDIVASDIPNFIGSHDPTIAPDAVRNVAHTEADADEFTDTPNIRSHGTINTSEILDIPIAFDGHSTSYTPNLFQTIRMCNATDMSSGLLTSDVTSTDVVNMSKASSAFSSSDVVNASYFSNVSGPDLYLQSNTSPECISSDDDRSGSLMSYSNTTPSSTLLASRPQFSPAPIQTDVDPMQSVSARSRVRGPEGRAERRDDLTLCSSSVALAAGSAGVVLQADYSSNGIMRVAPDAFHGFCALRRLNLADNVLRRLPTAALREMPRLQDLDVSGNNVTRLDFLKEGGGGALVELDASRNSIRSLPCDAFASAPALQILDLSANCIPALCDATLSPLRGLDKLSLAHNFLRDLPDDVLNHSAVLETVDLSNNQLSSLSFLRSDSVQFIDLSFNQIKGLEADTFARVPALKHLDLGDNEISFVDTMAFAGLSVLQFLNLAMNSITRLPDHFMMPMKAIKVLSVARNKISSFTDLTFAAPSESELLELDMSGNRLSSIHPHAFQHLPELRMINISFNLIKNLAKETFCKNFELIEFDLSENIPGTTFRLELSTPLLARAALMKLLHSHFGGVNEP